MEAPFGHAKYRLLMTEEPHRQRQRNDDDDDDDDDEGAFESSAAFYRVTASPRSRSLGRSANCCRIKNARKTAAIARGTRKPSRLFPPSPWQSVSGLFGDLNYA